MTQQPIFVVLLHEHMVDKTGKLVTTSLTLIDIHDIARSARTYGVQTTFIAHPATALRNLARSLYQHWDSGFGSEYNPDRKEALGRLDIAESFDEVLHKIELNTGKLPLKIATSAKSSPDSISFADFHTLSKKEDRPVLLAFGTGWGMSPPLLERFDYLLEPISGPGEYNHLSVRSACAIILDRICGRAPS